MRTSISIDGELLKKARVHAAQKHRSLSALIEDALREVLARRPTAAHRRARAVLPVVKGKPIAGVNYDSLASLLELTEAK
jgi:metal-responsive CopG/Arc/MetJ family transcriptional regulator